MPLEKWGCTDRSVSIENADRSVSIENADRSVGKVTPVIASVFYFVRWFAGRYGGALGQTHAAAKLGFERWLVLLGKPLAVHEHHSNQTSCE
jgi:hypothetical protein